jgi:hypothetical protein
MFDDLGDPTEVFRELVANADWPELSLRLLLFVCTYAEKRGVEATALPRGVDEYVRLGVEDVVNGVHGFDTRGKSLFAFLAASVGRRVDADLGVPPDNGKKRERRGISL